MVLHIPMMVSFVCGQERSENHCQRSKVVGALCAGALSNEDLWLALLGFAAQLYVFSLLFYEGKNIVYCR